MVDMLSQPEQAQSAFKELIDNEEDEETPQKIFKLLILIKSHFYMSRRTDLIQQLIRSTSLEKRKRTSRSSCMATAELILTDLIDIAI